MTRTEYERVHQGMRKSRVHRIFDTRGWFLDGHGCGAYTRAYHRCYRRSDGDAAVAVTYTTFRTPHHELAEKRRDIFVA